MAVVGPEGSQPWLFGLICMEGRGICIFEKLQPWEEGTGPWGWLALSSVSCLPLGGVGWGEQACAGQPRPYLVRGAPLSPCAIGQHSGSVRVEHAEGPTPHTCTCAHIHKHVLNIHVRFHAPLTPDHVHTTHLHPRADTGAHSSP